MTEAVEYKTTADRLGVLENRLRLAKKTLNEVIAFANGLEKRIEELEHRLRVKPDVSDPNPYKIAPL